MDAALPNDLMALSLLVFVLGLKHGFDADHLATIDGLTRYNSWTRPGLARYCGALFSLGHGTVVIAIALALSRHSTHPVEFDFRPVPTQSSRKSGKVYHCILAFISLSEGLFQSMHSVGKVALGCAFA